ncbi:MAG: M20/M25/M40 family metallo-hydrolase [Clostridiales Family XIII bacterium]|jgi:endoglucanase|nr:M20/M25/M40 family metallo-hydrolase [Clostridiales Family XIII bacterium]
MKEKIDRARVIALLREFDAVDGVSGEEERVADLLAGYLAPVTDEQRRDKLGNAVFTRKGARPDLSIMLSAHMDEIGFLVSDVTEAGLLTIVPVGYHIPNILVNHAVRIRTDGGEVTGVIGAGKPIHELLTENEKGKVFEWKDIFVDVGATSAEEVAALGIRPGDFANVIADSFVLNDRFFAGKAVDNRAGVVVMLLAMELLAGQDIPATVYACGTVQEELGLKGAEVLVRSLDPDYAICLDGCIGSPDGKLDDKARRCYAGAGPAIELYDWCLDTCHGNIVPKWMVRSLQSAAEKEGIRPQYSVMIDGGTDACVIMYGNHGIPTGGIALPTKNLHTTVGMVGIDDVIQAAALLARWILEFSPE